MDFRAYVRPVIAIGLTAVVIYLAITGSIEVDKVLTIYAVITGFYFGERKIEKTDNNNPDA